MYLIWGVKKLTSHEENILQVTLQHTATHCNTLQYTATQCSTASHCNTHAPCTLFEVFEELAGHAEKVLLSVLSCENRCVTVYCSVLQCIAVYCSVLQCVAVYWGDGSKPRRATNSISTGTKTVPVGPWGPRKWFLSSKVMNSQLQHIQKREIVDVQ